MKQGTILSVKAGNSNDIIKFPYKHLISSNVFVDGFWQWDPIFTKKNVPYLRNTARVCIYNNVYVYIYIYMFVLSHFKSRYQCHANIKGVFFFQFEDTFFAVSIRPSISFQH